VFLPNLLQGKRILITGGGTGLGRAMAARFLDLGAEVAICGRREEVLTAAAADLAGKAPGRVTWRRLDIRDPEAVEAAIEALWREKPLDALVNNAAGNILARSESLSHRAVDAVVGTVLHGAAYLTLACGRRWIGENRAGNVLSIVTTYAWTGSAYVVPSAMAKAGVLAMTRSLAVEWGPKNIRLNAVAPGPFPTEGAWERLVPNKQLEQAWRDRIPLGRFGRHEELTDLAAYLLSDRSGYITGEVVAIDGGEWLKGAGQFSMAEALSDADWEAIKPKGKKK
jgi:NAD(P)-dependent dehydrogenase (short-subunit alcohol dehydrogenase family)